MKNNTTILFYIFIIQVDINNVANDFLKKILWTDKCTFRSDGRINYHNEHHYAEENPHCRKKTYVQEEYNVNVWMGMVDNIIIGPPFFPEHINITAEVYLEFLEKILPNLDFFVWSYIRDHVYQTLSRNQGDLIEKIKATSCNITPAMINKMRQSFMRRVALCLEKSGGYSNSCKN